MHHFSTTFKSSSDMPESCQSSVTEDSLVFSVSTHAQPTDNDRQHRRHNHNPHHSPGLQEKDQTDFLPKRAKNVVHKLAKKVPKTARNSKKSESSRKCNFDSGRHESSCESPEKHSVTSVESHAMTQKLSRDEKRRRRRATEKYRTAHASRERIRVEAFNVAFGRLRQLLPTLPPDKKLSKIEVLRLAICYISYLDHVLQMP